MEKITTGRRAPFGANPEVGDAGKATQQRIIAAANEAFAEFGYERTSVEAITGRAGCSRPTFYQYFSSKEDVHRRMAARLGNALSMLLGELGEVTPDQAGRDELATWLLGLTSVHNEYRAVADSFSASVRTDPQMVSGADALSSSYRDVLVGAVQKPLTDPDLAALVTVLNNAAFGACMNRDRIGDVSTERLASALADFVHRSLFGPIDGVNLAPKRRSVGRRGTTGSSLTLVDTTDDDERRPRGMRTRERLLDSAMTAFAILGYERVRVDDIVREAAVSHGTFYRYFPDKDAAFTELALRATIRTSDLIDDLPATDDLPTWMRIYYDLYANEGGAIANLPEARRAGVPVAALARAHTSISLKRSLTPRPFGDVDADLMIAFALLESVPAAAFRPGGISIDASISASSFAVERGLLGR
jgi:AcrR family transcriptional regulator